MCVCACVCAHARVTVSCVSVGLGRCQEGEGLSDSKEIPLPAPAQVPWQPPPFRWPLSQRGEASAPPPLQVRRPHRGGAGAGEGGLGQAAPSAVRAEAQTEGSCRDWDSECGRELGAHYARADAGIMRGRML